VPGEYSVQVGDVVLGTTVTVAGPPAVLGAVTLAPGGDAVGRIEAALTASTHVTLLPGQYFFTRALRVPDWATITGPGAVLVKVTNPADRFDCMIVPGDNTTFDGLTFHGTDAVAFNDHGGRNAVFVRCMFQDCQLGYWVNDGLLVERCTFNRASAGIVRCGLYHRCRWVGLCRHFHAWVAWGQPDDRIRPAVIECDFDGTDRGPGLTPNWGDLSDTLLCSLDLRGISKTYGGNELFGFETGGQRKPLRRLLVLHVRAYQSEGQVQFWTGEVTDCLLRDLVLDGPSVCFSAADRSAQTGNVIEESEFRGGGVQFAPTATGNTIRRTLFTAWRPTRANIELRPTAFTNRAVVEAAGPLAASNRVLDSRILAPAGVPAVTGVTLTPAADP